LNGARRVLYHLPELLASDPRQMVVVVEGEKDVERLRGLGLVATCNVGGAGKWKAELAEHLTGRDVVILPDNDAPGRKHAEQVAASLHGKAASVKRVDLPGVPDKGDVSDWLDAGGTKDELLRLCEDAAEWEPSAELAVKPEHDPLAVDSPEGQTDISNARRFVDLHGDSVRYCHPWQKWVAWDGARWKVDDDGAATRLCESVADAVWNEARQSNNPSALKFAVRTASAAGVRAMATLAASHVAILPDQLDTHGWALNCPNGTVDLKTGELREHRRLDFLTKLCPTPFNANASAYQWDRFLEDVFGGDQTLIDFLQVLCGYSLTASTQEQILPIFYGSGANGKSTLLGTFLETIGPDYGMKAATDLLMARRNEDHPTKLADLFGKRFVACVETGEGRRLNETIVKELTGGDTIRARRMREDFWEFQPTHKLVVCTNHKPAVRGTDHAIWRRLRLVPFTQIFGGEKQDKSLPEKLRDEAEGILAWSVEGCLRWQRDGLRSPEAVKVATADYRQSQDVVAEFVADACIVQSGATVKSNDLFAAYSEWCKTAGERPMSRTRFGTSLAAAGYLKRRSNGVYWDGLDVLSGA